MKQQLCDRAQPICFERLSTHEQCTYGTGDRQRPCCIPCTLQKDICDGELPTCFLCLVVKRECYYIQMESADESRNHRCDPLNQQGSSEEHGQGLLSQSLKADDVYKPQARLSNADVVDGPATFLEVPKSDSVRGGTEQSPDGKRKRSSEKEMAPRKALKATKSEPTTTPQIAVAAEIDRIFTVRDGVLPRVGNPFKMYQAGTPVDSLQRKAITHATTKSRSSTLLINTG